jgi:hypothetical protein
MMLRQGSQKKRHGTGTIVGTALALLIGAGVILEGPAEAQRLRAQIYLTQARIPRNVTERGLIRFARSHNARRLQETSGPIAERTWRAEMVTAFNRSPGDLEYQVLFYDLEDGARRFIEPPLSTFINNRDEKTFVRRINLERPRFEPNHRMELVVVVRRNEVGRARFETRGEVIQNSGVVSFD